jgi:hypothetical protein
MFKEMNGVFIGKNGLERKWPEPVESKVTG